MAAQGLHQPCLPLPALAIIGTFLLLCGCQPAVTEIPQLQVQPTTLRHQISAEGELYAVNATAVVAPTLDGGPRFIASIKADYSQVQPGDVVVSFAARQLHKDQRQANSTLAGLNADLQQKQTEQQADQQKLNLEQQLVLQEYGFAERFTIDDVQIRSRLEILDSLQNKQYLQQKKSYLGWQSQSFSEKISGELGLIQAQQQQQQHLLSQADAGLNSLDIQAPHQGMLLFDADWRGEKPSIGTMVFPGEKIGSIPDLSLQQLKLQVIEQEAAGIKPGQPVSFVMLARPELKLSGKVLTVSGNAQSRQRRDPRKYIEVIVAPDAQHAAFLPGNKVQATILVQEKAAVLQVPLQALFSKQQHLYVWKATATGFVPQQVQVGAKSLTHAEITSGLTAADQVALLDVNNWQQEP
jgi:multidrug resistance efflux pump